MVIVFKAGDANDPDNYRPISVLTILLKILEKTVHSRLMAHLETENLLLEFSGRITTETYTLFDKTCSSYDIYFDDITLAYVL